MKILLHTCCAPCLIYPLEELEKKGFKVAGFFYNPNIHPFSEYKLRKEAFDNLTAEILFPAYMPQEFFQAVNLRENAPDRCAICWSLRLDKTAQYAKKNGFDAFTTTLLVSPYQNQELLKEIGEQIAIDRGIEFLYQDFRPGFRKAHDKAKEKGIYCQKYCGCLYSELERFTKTGKN
ncbi:MAG: epoxyqueuosine reductase QueH [Candidatus Omnitrophica bacterium]|nr:epoxyqueuosine reductase QueH [Candidatus Omnitrophota bacterium]